jgi:hypothetical protein
MLNPFLPASVYFTEMYLTEHSKVIFCRNIQSCARHAGVNTGAAYCDIYN